MSGSQQDEHPAIQHFFQWYREERQHGCVSSETPSESFFLPHEAAETYLRERRRVQNLLEAVFTDGDYAKYPDIAAIQANYCKVFCILLRIGEAKFINHFIRCRLDDKHLPLKSEPDDFPQSSKPFWEDFERRQWEFCAPIFEYNMDWDLAGHVLPIVKQEALREGGSGASTYKIVLHKSFDRLHPEYHKRAGPPEPEAHTYVLKTYRTKDAERYYRNEVDGFKRLRYNGTSGKPCSQIIGFYGNFTQKDSYNILLEYANEGTLEDYFDNIPPPSNGPDIVTFWNGLLCGAFEALKIIHLAGHAELKERPIFHGWHQDLKPANILVKSCSDEEDKLQPEVRRRYKSKFKVADLGLSHFRKSVPSAEAADRDARGTRTYGAPECCRDPITEESTLVVRQNVDVWSLGCVLSEAVVWVINGYHHVGEYRQNRSQETADIDDFDEGDCFHDGFEVLKSVGKAHEAHLADRRAKDCITEKVVDLIENHMLVEADERLNAKQLYIKAKKIIKAAREELRMEDHDDVVDDIQPQRNVSKSVAHHNQRPKKETQTEAESSRSGITSSHGGRFDTTPTAYGRNDLASDYSNSTDENVQDSRKGKWPDDGETEEPRPDSRSVAHNFHHMSPSLEFEKSSGSNHGWSGHDAAQGKRSAHGPNQNLDHRETLGSVAESQAETIVAPAQSNTGASSLGQAPTFPAAPPPGSPARHPSPSLLPDLRPLSHALGRLDLDAPLANTVQRRPTTRAPPPFLSFQEALQWKQKRKANKSRSLPNTTPFPYEYLLGDLKDRDCAFLIDDAASMAPYWTDVKECLGLLGYIVKETDKDGFEVYFTNKWRGSKGKRVKDSSKLVAEAEGRQLIGESNMREALGRILEEYKGKLAKTTSSSEWFGLKKGVKRLNLYILTDGVWQDPCDIEPMIRDMVQKTGELGLINAQIGIQFIQFGNDEQGSKRLNYFDSFLKDQQDIVDNEPFENGNVFKMLLGAINKYWDQDPQRNHQATESVSSSSSQAPP